MLKKYIYKIHSIPQWINTISFKLELEFSVPTTFGHSRPVFFYKITNHDSISHARHEKINERM